jgi:hypothetical protein
MRIAAILAAALLAASVARAQEVPPLLLAPACATLSAEIARMRVILAAPSKRQPGLDQPRSHHAYFVLRSGTDAECQAEFDTLHAFLEAK